MKRNKLLKHTSKWMNKSNQTQTVLIVWFYLYEVLEYTKLLSTNRSQKMIAWMGQEKETDWKKARKNFLGDEHVFLSWSGWCFTNTFFPQKNSVNLGSVILLYMNYILGIFKNVNKLGKLLFPLGYGSQSFHLSLSILACCLPYSRKKISSLCPASSIFFFPFIP